MNRLPLDFYLRSDVVAVARDLLGKTLVTEIDGHRTSGKITETEAYRAPDDRACHAFNNRRTTRTEVMFQSGGRAYVYLCYGIHHLFNVVTGPAEAAHAVLIRAIEPLDGLEKMLERRGLEPFFYQKNAAKKTRLTTGPGALSQALGLTTALTNHSFLEEESLVWLEENEMQVPENQIVSSKRVGVDYAGECAEWLWRFSIRDSEWVSKPTP